MTFAYDETKTILKDVSFTVNPGESVALVGPTGAGKSTIVNLISRFYNVNDGKVLIDDQDIADVTIHSLRAQMGIMMQDSFIFREQLQIISGTENWMLHRRKLKKREKLSVPIRLSGKCRKDMKHRCGSVGPCFPRDRNS